MAVFCVCVQVCAGVCERERERRFEWLIEVATIIMVIVGKTQTRNQAQTCSACRVLHTAGCVGHTL